MKRLEREVGVRLSAREVIAQSVDEVSVARAHGRHVRRHRLAALGARRGRHV
jgi:hypothetical protein